MSAAFRAKVFTILIIVQLVLCTHIFAENEYSDCESKSVYCTCGSDEQSTIRVILEMCLKEDPVTGKKVCEPCSDLYPDQNYCGKFKDCLTCAENPSRCDQCPSGKTGKFCEIDMTSSDGIYNTPKEQIRLSERREEQRFVSMEQRSNPKLMGPRIRNGNAVRCLKQETSVVGCEIQCHPGYMFPDATETKFMMSKISTTTESVWYPIGFLECIPKISCASNFRLDTYVLCSILSTNITMCNFYTPSCTSSNYYCLHGERLWIPPLPSCVLS